MANETRFSRGGLMIHRAAVGCNRWLCRLVGRYDPARERQHARMTVERGAIAREVPPPRA